jgi:hypothetical protein
MLVPKTCGCNACVTWEIAHPKTAKAATFGMSYLSQAFLHKWLEDCRDIQLI